MATRPGERETATLHFLDDLDSQCAAFIAEIRDPMILDLITNLRNNLTVAAYVLTVQIGLMEHTPTPPKA